MRKLPTYTSVYRAERRGYGWGQGLSQDSKLAPSDWDKLPPRIAKSLSGIGEGRIIERATGIIGRIRDSMMWGESGSMGFGIINKIRSFF